MIESTGKTAVRLRGLDKSFGAVSAVKGLDLDVQQGEFFSMLGPSGSGKTTVLRIIAGFEQPDAGTVEISGLDVTKRSASERDVTTVFQDYALFPHMTVLENVAYGLKVRGITKSKRRQEAIAALASMKLEQHSDRKPEQLSGGQRQRVALARALVVKPKILLLDEPLGAVDRQLREQMQLELKELQRNLGIAFIFVTHDQQEALSLSDRVAVFNEGRIEQVAKPAELYEQPATKFVASFVGSSNIFVEEEAKKLLSCSGTYSLRPERITVKESVPSLEQDSTDEIKHSGVISETTYEGATIQLHINLNSGKKIISTQMAINSLDQKSLRGQQVTVSWLRKDLVALNN